MRSKFALSFLLCTSALAQTSNFRIEYPQGWWFYAGGEGGYMGLSAPPEEANKDGLNLGVNFLGSYYLEENWVFDIGVGWSYSRLSGNKDDTLRIIKTRGGFIETSARYRIYPNLQIGVVADTLFGAGYHFKETNSKSLASMVSFMGLQGVYEVPYTGFRLRLGGKLVTDVSLPKRQGYIAALEVDIGLPWRHIPRLFGAKEWEVDVKDQTTVTLNMRQGFIPFETDSADLNNWSQNFLKELAVFLKVNSDLWASIIVEGHTDQRGNDDYNQKLSERRAKSVRVALEKTGVDSTKIESIGLGETKLVDERDIEEAWAKNRRVEISFKGVKDPDDLTEKLENLVKQLEKTP